MHRTPHLAVVPEIVRGPGDSPDCGACPLVGARGRPNRPVRGEGPAKPQWIAIGEGPGQSEIIEGRPFVGPSGRVLQRMLDSVGSPREDVWVTNATLCVPPSTKTDAEMAAARAACAPRLAAELASMPGAPVLTMGAVAARAILGDTFRLSEFAGTLNDSTDGRAVIPTHHPAYILRGGAGNSPGDRAVELLFYNLIYDAAKVAALGRGEDIRFSDDIEIELDRPERARALLEKVYTSARKHGFVACDVETDALGARTANLTAIAFATLDFGVSIAASLLVATTWEVIDKMADDASISWVYHNRLYDELVLWRYDVEPKGPAEDTLLKHHAAFAGTSHKLQDVATQFFAIRPWKAEFRKGGGFGRMSREGQTELLRYNCLAAGVPVVLEDGSTELVETLVRQCRQVRVQSWNPDANRMEAREVIGWHQQRVPEQDWIRIQTAADVPSGRGLVVTPDHEVYCSHGRVRAEHVRVGDELIIPEPKLTAYETQALWGRRGPRTATVTVAEPYDPPRDTAQQRLRAETRFCITVEGNHNFFTSFGLVKNCRDALVTARLVPPLDDSIAQTNTGMAYEVDNKLAPYAMRAEMHGVPVHLATNAELHDHFQALIQSSEGHIYATAHDPALRETWIDELAMIRALDRRKSDPPDFLSRHAVRMGELGHGIERKKPAPGLTRCPVHGEAEIATDVDDGTGVYDYEPCCDQDALVYPPKRFLKGKGPTRFSLSNADHIAAYLKARGHRLWRMTQGGKPSTAKDVLEDMAHVAEVRDILTYREASKLDSTFVRGLPVTRRDWVTGDPLPEGWGRLHPSWTLNKITGRWGSSPNCFTGATEILTDAGWIRFDELQPRLDAVRVAQFHEGPDTIEFVSLPPEAYIKSHYEGELVSIDATQTQLLCTPNHRVLLEKRHGGREVVEARALWAGTSERAFLHAPVSYEGPSSTPSAPKLQFLCAAQADGWWQVSGWGFALTRPRKIKRLRQILRELGMTWTEKAERRTTRFKRHAEHVKFYVHAHPVSAWAREQLSPAKSWGPWLLDWHGTALDHLLDEIMHWGSAHIRRNCYSSSNKESADWIQIVAMLRGHRAKLRAYNGSAAQTKTNWRVDISWNRRSTTMSLGRNPHRPQYRAVAVPYAGPVYCVTVPSGYIVTRHEGRITILNNCQNWPKQNQRGRPNLRRQVVAPPGRMLVGADKAQLEARVIGLLSGDEFLCSIFMEGFGQCAAGCRPDVEPVKFCDVHDIHTVFACEVFPGFMDLSKDARKEMRDLTKRGEYGGFYKGSIDTLYQSIVKEMPHVKFQDVARIVRIIADRMPGVALWHQELIKQAMQGEVHSAIFHRRRTFPLGHFDLSVVVNFPVQATAADIFDLDLLAVCEALPDIDPTAAFIIHGHDAAYVECDEDRADDVAAMMTKEMTRTVEVDGVRMFFPADATAAKSWDKL